MMALNCKPRLSTFNEERFTMRIEPQSAYNGAGVYALVDSDGLMYIGSSLHCLERIKEHAYNSTSRLLREALSSGTTFTATILEELPGASDAVLAAAEGKHIREAGDKAFYNQNKHPTRTTRRKSDQPRSVAEFARSRGVTPQAVYKRLSKVGIDPSSLRETKPGNKAGGDLSSEGLAVLIKVMGGDGGLSTENPSNVNSSSSTGDVNPEVERLQSELNALQHDLIEARHKAEVAEIRATAAEDERDYLRSQLDNAIKASALASMRRIAAASTEDDEQDQRSSVMVEEVEPAETTAQQPVDAPVRKSGQDQPRSLRQRWRDAVMAWKGKA